MMWKFCILLRCTWNRLLQVRTNAKTWAKQEWESKSSCCLAWNFHTLSVAPICFHWVWICSNVHKNQWEFEISLSFGLRLSFILMDYHVLWRSFNSRQLLSLFTFALKLSWALLSTLMHSQRVHSLISSHTHLVLAYSQSTSHMTCIFEMWSEYPNLCDNFEHWLRD